MEINEFQKYKKRASSEPNCDEYYSDDFEEIDEPKIKEDLMEID